MWERACFEDPGLLADCIEDLPAHRNSKNRPYFTSQLIQITYTIN